MLEDHDARRARCRIFKDEVVLADYGRPDQSLFDLIDHPRHVRSEGMLTTTRGFHLHQVIPAVNT
jgi:hypothetical protein